MDNDSPAARRGWPAHGAAGSGRSSIACWPTPARRPRTRANPLAARTAAVRSLRFAGLPEVEGPLAELLAPRQPPDVQAEAIETLARFDDPRVPSRSCSAAGRR